MSHFTCTFLRPSWSIRIFTRVRPLLFTELMSSTSILKWPTCSDASFKKRKKKRVREQTNCITLSATITRCAQLWEKMYHHAPARGGFIKAFWKCAFVLGASVIQLLVLFFFPSLQAQPYWLFVGRTGWVSQLSLVRLHGDRTHGTSERSSRLACNTLFLSVFKNKNNTNANGSIHFSPKEKQ